MKTSPLSTLNYYGYLIRSFRGSPGFTISALGCPATLHGYPSKSAAMEQVNSWFRDGASPHPCHTCGLWAHPDLDLTAPRPLC